MSVASVAPASISAADWTANTGTSLAAVQSVGDSLWIGGGSGNAAFVTIGAWAFDAGETVNALRIRIVARATSGSPQIRFGVRTAAGGATTYFGAYQTIASGWDTYEWEWAVNPTSGNPWTRAELNTIPRVYFACAVTGPTLDIDVIAADADYGSNGGETKTSAATISLGLAAAGAASKHATAAAGLDLELATTTDPAKTGQSATTLAALLDMATTAAKTGVAATALGVVLSPLVEASKTGQSSAAIDVGLDVDGHATKAAQAAGIITLALAIDGWTIKHTSATTTLALLLDTTAQATKTAHAAVALDLLLTLAAAIAQPVPDVDTPESRTLTIAWQDRTLVIDRQDRTLTITGG